MNIYDFDDTIYDGESILDFFLCYVRENPAFLRFIPKVLFGFVKYKLGIVTLEKMQRDYFPIIKKWYCEYDDWEGFTKRFWDTHMHKIKPFYAEVRRDDDIILTASPELTMREIARRLEIRNLVCSRIDEETGEVTRLCMRQNKILALREDFGDVEIDDFYTDSMKNDGFFAEHAKRVFLVKGNKIKRIK